MRLAGSLLLDKVRLGVQKRVFPPFLEKARIEVSKISGDDAGWLHPFERVEGKRRPGRTSQRPKDRTAAK